MVTFTEKLDFAGNNPKKFPGGAALGPRRGAGPGPRGVLAVDSAGALALDPAGAAPLITVWGFAPVPES